jgi:hypothetical protein
MGPLARHGRTSGYDGVARSESPPNRTRDRTVRSSNITPACAASLLNERPAAKTQPNLKRALYSACALTASTRVLCCDQIRNGPTPFQVGQLTAPMLLATCLATNPRKASTPMSALRRSSSSSKLASSSEILGTWASEPHFSFERNEVHGRGADVLDESFRHEG